MNQTLENWVHTKEPKIPTLSEKERDIYRYGLIVLASFTKDGFIDLPLLPANRFEQDGLYYTIPYFHDEMLLADGENRTMLVVWEVKNRSSFCPLRIEMELGENADCKLVLHDQRGEKTVKTVLIQREGDAYYTELSNQENMTLSEFLQ